MHDLVPALAFNAIALIAAFFFAIYLRPPFPDDRTPLSLSAKASLTATIRTGLTEAQKLTFLEQGFLLLPQAVPVHAIAELRSVLEANPPATSPLMKGAVSHSCNHCWTAIRAFRDFSFSGLTASLAAELLAPPGHNVVSNRARLVNSIAYGLKPGESGANWHIDSPSFRGTELSGELPSSCGSDKGQLI